MPDRNQKDLQEVPPAILANMEVISSSPLQILINPTKEPRHLKKVLNCQVVSIMLFMRIFIFCIIHKHMFHKFLPCLVSFWCMLGGSEEFCTHNEDQTQFGMPRGAKMSLALNEPK